MMKENYEADLKDLERKLEASGFKDKFNNVSENETEKP